MNYPYKECAKAAGIGPRKLLKMLLEARWILRTNNNTGYTTTTLGREKGLFAVEIDHPSPRCQGMVYSKIHASWRGRENIMELVAEFRDHERQQKNRNHNNVRHQFA